MTGTALRTLPAMLLSYLESLPEPHILFDHDYRIVASNTAYRTLYATDDTVIGKTCHQVSHHSDVPCDQAGETCPLRAALTSGQRERTTHLHHLPSGQAYFNIELTPLRDSDNGVIYFLEKMEPLRIDTGSGSEGRLVGKAPAFRRMLDNVVRAGEAEISVLLLGESGTGKELVAHALHDISPRRARALVVVECASLSEALFESELFGHEKGAFTGATSTKQGLVESANGGTLFLDEVGDIPLSMQVKLLRLIETGCYRRVGSTELRHTDLRIVSATHRDLKAMVAAGTFRQDLFFRLSAFPIRIPPLRERIEDLELLARTLLKRLRLPRELVIAPAAIERLKRYGYPGNIREMRNILERAALMADGSRLTESHIEQAMDDGIWRVADTADGRCAADADTRPSNRQPGPIPLKTLESDALKSALAQHRGSRKSFAQGLGISERTLYRRLKPQQD